MLCRFVHLWSRAKGVYWISWEDSYVRLVYNEDILKHVPSESVYNVSFEISLPLLDKIHSSILVHNT